MAESFARFLLHEGAEFRAFCGRGFKTGIPGIQSTTTVCVPTNSASSLGSPSSSSMAITSRRFACSSSGELLQFLGVGSGSLAELDTQLEISARLGYAEDIELTKQCSRVGQLLVALRRSIKGKKNRES